MCVCVCVCVRVCVYVCSCICFRVLQVFEVDYQNHYEPFLLGTRELPLFDQVCVTRVADPGKRCRLCLV
jgi:hypothetical protein